MRLFHPLKTAMATRGAGPAVAGAARAGPAGLRPPAPFSAVAVTATRFPHHPRHDALVPPGGRGSHARPAWLRAPSTSQYRWMSDKVRAHWQPLIPSTTTSRLLEHLNLSTWGTRESPRAYASHPTRGPQGGEAGGHHTRHMHGSYAHRPQYPEQCRSDNPLECSISGSLCPSFPQMPQNYLAYTNRQVLLYGNSGRPAEAEAEAKGAGSQEVFSRPVTGLVGDDVGRVPPPEIGAVTRGGRLDDDTERSLARKRSMVWRETPPPIPAPRSSINTRCR